MFAMRRDICQIAVIIFMYVMDVVTTNSCNVFKSISNVTMDTSVCFFQNFTQPVSKWICVDSCKRHQNCTGALRKQDLQIHWCCLVTVSDIQYWKPGEMILYYKSNTPLKCHTGWAGRNCDACALNYGPPGHCDQCLKGFAGKKCDKCATNFVPPGQCDRCVLGWAGINCDSCATGWMGNNCTICSPNFEPDGRCDRCLVGWAGDNCDVCDFGFSTESNCTECIHNGHWTGTYSQARAPLRAYLTFEGPACTNLVPGTTTYSAFNRQVISGNYDNTTGTLVVHDNYYNPVGSVDVVNKRINGSIAGFPFTLSHQGSV